MWMLWKQSNSVSYSVEWSYKKKTEKERRANDLEKISSQVDIGTLLKLQVCVS